MKKVELENFVRSLKGICENAISEIDNSESLNSEFIKGYTEGTRATYGLIQILLRSLENGVFDYEIQDEKQSRCEGRLSGSPER